MKTGITFDHNYTDRLITFMKDDCPLYCGAIDAVRNAWENLDATMDEIDAIPDDVERLKVLVRMTSTEPEKNAYAIRLRAEKMMKKADRERKRIMRENQILAQAEKIKASRAK